MVQARWRIVLPVALLAVALSCARYPDEDDGPPEWSHADCGEPKPSRTIALTGSFTGAEHWECTVTTTEHPLRFDSSTGTTTVVTGGSTVLQLVPSGGDPVGHRIVAKVPSEVGYVITPPLEAAPNPFPLEIFFGPGATQGEQVLSLGIEDGTGTVDEPHVGAWLEVPFNIIRVKTGDIQVNVNWDTEVDVDLHVTDPSGFEVYYGDRQAPSGGELDLDANVGCRDDVANENIYWPEGRAPAGEYVVEVVLYSAWKFGACETEEPVTNYRLTAIVGGQVAQVKEGSLPAALAGTEGNTDHQIRFTWPPP